MWVTRRKPETEWSSEALRSTITWSFFPGFFLLLFLTLLFIYFSRRCSLNCPDMGQGSAQTRCWSQLREKVVEYWWLAVAGAILAYPVLHRANMYWSDRWYHKTKQEKMTWSWLSYVFNTPCLHSVEDWYPASNRPWNQNDPHTADLIHSTTYREDQLVF